MTRNKRKRIVPKRERELAFLRTGAVVAGVDEVGRGAWAGPVVAGAVMLDPDYRIKKAYDSKLMKHAERVQLAKRIKARARGIGVGIATLEEVNRYGLTWAVTVAGSRAVDSLPEAPSQILLDGNYDYFKPYRPCEVIIDGDCHELCIAAASIIAKVERDRLMTELDQDVPGYGFAEHKGYGTPTHRRALREQGVSPAHRTGWAPVAAALQMELFATA